MDDRGKIITEIAADKYPVYHEERDAFCRYCGSNEWNKAPIRKDGASGEHIKHNADCIWMRAKGIEEKEAMPMLIVPQRNEGVCGWEGSLMESIYMTRNKVEEYDFSKQQRNEAEAWIVKQGHMLEWDYAYGSIDIYAEIRNKEQDTILRVTASGQIALFDHIICYAAVLLYKRLKKMSAL